MMRTLLLAMLLASPLALAIPAASAADCDGDPMYWNPDYPTYGVCKAAIQWVDCVFDRTQCPT